MTGSWILFPIIAALTAVYVPSIWYNTFMLIDYMTPWKIFDSQFVDMYHEFLVNNRPDIPEMPLREIKPSEATKEYIVKMSNGFTEPLVVRGWLQDSPGVKKWGSKQFWLDNYGDEEVLCGVVSNVKETCTIRDFFNALNTKDAFYISGAAHIFERHPELHEMVDNEGIKKLNIGVYSASQLFIGSPGTGSHMHSAMGVNIFRMVAGRKRWWFIPPSETPYLKASININGYSCHTKTLLDIGDKKQSPWLKKLTRYTATLVPGDVLFNPPWYWHGIVNEADSKDDLIIGVPTRFRKGETIVAAFRSNFFLTCVTYATFFRKYGVSFLTDPNFKMNLQGDVAKNRQTRFAQDVEKKLQM